MKKILLGLVIVASSSLAARAQCDKKILLTSSKTEYLDASGNVTRSVDEKSSIQFDKDQVIITPGDDPVMTGTFKVDTCSWKKPFKEGKSVYSAVFEGQDNRVMHVAITVESKDGKIQFLAAVKEQPDRVIRLYPDKFEEAK